MKKVALSLMAFALVGVGAFAQAAPAAPVVKIGDWGRQLFVIGNDDNNNVYNTVAASWGGAPRIVGLSISAQNENGGFVITPSADNGTFGLTDQNKAWVTPLPGLNFEAGINMETDTWRDTADFGSWDWARVAGTQGDGFAFYRVGGENGGTYEADVNYNNNGIGFWALEQLGGASGSSPAYNLNATGAFGGGKSPTNAGILNNAQIGAAYTIAGIGQIKAQFMGYNMQGTNDATAVENQYTNDVWGNVQAAFDLTAVQNLTLNIGILVPTNANDAGYTFGTKDYVQYVVDKFTLHGLFQLMNYNGNNAGSSTTPTTESALDASGKATGSGIGLIGGVAVDYDLGSAVTATAEYRYLNALQEQNTSANDAAGGNKSDTNAVGVWVNKSFQNGNMNIGAGFQYTSSFFAVSNTSTTTGSTAAGHWVIPIRLQESF